jgi:putative two-component system response regulator
LETLQSTILQTRRVLVVDDDQATLRTLGQLLEDAGCETTCVPDAHLACALLAERTYDLVLTDLYLGTDQLGYTVAEAARTRRPQVPVVMLTGRPSFHGAVDALRSSIREIVVKPVDPEVLIDACAKAIETASLERKRRQLEAQNRVLMTVAPRMIEAKDPTTSGHAERVIQYTDRLAERCGVGDEERESLRMAALLHDVGKIGVPRAILCKEGPLTAAEREVIQAHPQVGYDILADLEDCEDVRLWVVQHHERWDGRGYPHGLRGEEVALPGRILILAEVYDALAEARSYKPAWPLDKISAFFREQAGKHFDPELAHLVADGLDREGRRFFAPRTDLLF